MALWHGVPRLDNPSRIWLLPAPVAKWLILGALVGPLYAQASDFVLSQKPGTAFLDGLTWVIALVGLCVGLTGAFFRPGGHDLGRWLQCLLDYAASPRTTRWKPGGD
jgi:hypothetical protein